MKIDAQCSAFKVIPNTVSKFVQHKNEDMLQLSPFKSVESVDAHISTIVEAPEAAEEEQQEQQ